MGESVAVGLGQQTVWVKAATTACVVVLAGSAVAIARPIGFVGLVVPHLTRAVMGVDYRWVVIFTLGNLVVSSKNQSSLEI